MKDYKLGTPINLQHCIDAQQIALNHMQDDKISETLQDLLYAYNQSLIIAAAWKEIVEMKWKEICKDESPSK